MFALESVPIKDIASAAIAGSSAIAAVLLVFVGFMLAKAEALPSETEDAVIKRYVRTAKLGVVPLIALVVVTLAAYLWMFFPSSSVLFWTWTAGFVIGAVLFMLYCILTVVLM